MDGSPLGLACSSTASIHKAMCPLAIVEFTRYAGDSIEAPIISRKIISGRLPDQLRGTWTQLQANLVSVAAPADGVRSPYLPEYPLEALKELARNLVQHRMYEGTNAPSRVTWFDDRIEMTNPEVHSVRRTRGSSASTPTIGIPPSQGYSSTLDTSNVSVAGSSVPERCSRRTATPGWTSRPMG